ncbi:MAG: hypothetical protein GY795_23620 [Desulfobacterales bacterium]|nr:hypothetical protein [Desulfobacterales bacterium]
MPFNGDETTPADTVTPEEFAQIYSDYGYGEAIYRHTDSLSHEGILEDVAGARVDPGVVFEDHEK